MCYVCPPFIESEAIWLYFEVGPSIHFSAVSCRLIINEEGCVCVRQYVVNIAMHVVNNY